MIREPHRGAGLRASDGLAAAEAAFLRAIDADEGAFEPYSSLARLAGRRGEAHVATDYMEKALERRPEEPGSKQGEEMEYGSDLSPQAPQPLSLYATLSIGR